MTLAGLSQQAAGAGDGYWFLFGPWAGIHADIFSVCTWESSLAATPFIPNYNSFYFIRYIGFIMYLDIMYIYLDV
jgi:hypothetical protein